MSMYRVLSCVVGRGCLLWPMHFLGKTLLFFAMLHSVFQGQICLLFQVFLDFQEFLDSLSLYIYIERDVYTQISCFIVFCRYCAFLKKMKKKKVCGNSESTVYWFPFSISFAHFMSLCHILIIFETVQTLHQQKHYHSLKAWMMITTF